MGITRITLFLALGATLSAAEASPEPLEKPKPKAEAGATVTVTAEATNIEIAKTPNPVKVITQEVLERENPRNLSELLTSLFPGQINANGGVGTLSSFQLGGARSQDVVVTLDGIRLSDPTGFGSVSPSSVGMIGIERVEVQQGPCSSRFGAESMGGVVALYTNQAAPVGWAGEVALGAGSQSIFKGRASASYGFEGAWVRAAVDRDQEAQATETANDYRSQGAFLAAGFNLGADTVTSFSYRNTYQAVPIPYQSVSPTIRTYDENRETSSRNQQIIGSLRSSLSSTLLAELSVGYAETNRWEPNDYAVPKHQEPFSGRRAQVVVGLNWEPVKEVGFSFGMDADEEHARISDYQGGTNRGEAKHLAASLEGHVEPTSWLRLVGSYRQQWFRQAFLFDAFAGVPAETESKGTFKVGANMLLPGNQRLYASCGTGFGLPVLYAVMFQSNELLNPASWNYNPAAYRPLDPEKSTFAQAGWSWASGPWSARVEASRTRFDSLVYFDLNSYLYGNGQEIRIQGLEGAVAYRTEGWGLEGFVRNQEARDEQAPESQRFSTNAVIRRPFNTAGLSGYWTEGPWRVEGRWNWSGARYENFGGYPALLGASKTHFNAVAANLRYRLNPNLDFTLRGENLLQRSWSVQEWKNRAMDGKNDAYQVFGFPAQPRTLTLEARYRF